MEAQHTPAQRFALLAGLSLMALGLLSVIVYPIAFGETRFPAELLIWKVSGWNALLWTAVGASGVFASSGPVAARWFALAAALIFGTLAVWGFVDSGYEMIGVFAIGTPGNVTHAIVAAIAAFVVAPRSRKHSRPVVGPAKQDDRGFR